jgi:type IV secretion system protein VirB1
LPLDLATLLTLAPVCAPAVAPSTLLAVARTESGFDPLAIGVNGQRPSRLSFTSRTAAAEAARRLIANGQNIDLGLSQINARNLASLGLSIDAAFDPCRNLAASAKVLQVGFTRAAPRPGEEQAGLRTALSYYNTGGPDRGFRNGYVRRVVAAAASLEAPVARHPPALTAASPPPWDAFGDLGTAAFVAAPTAAARGATP